MTTANTAESIYLQKLNERLALAEKYNELTHAQKKSIEADDANALLTSLKERGSLIEAIERVSEELAALEKASAGKSPSEEAKAVISRTRELFSEVLDIDKENMAAVNKLMAQTSAQGKNLTKSRDGISKYAQKNMQYDPGFFDKKQ